MIPEVSHVSDRHSLNAERLLVGRSEPSGELSHIVFDRLTGVSAEVVRRQKLIKKARFLLADRDAAENIIARIFHGLFPKSRHTLGAKKG